MDKQEIIAAIRSNPECAKLIAELKAAPNGQAAIAALDRLWRELFLLCGRNHGNPDFDPRTNPNLDPAICAVWNSLNDLKSGGLKEADEFLISLLKS